MKIHAISVTVFPIQQVLDFSIPSIKPNPDKRSGIRVFLFV
jgi:hypothetical protein